MPCKNTEFQPSNYKLVQNADVSIYFKVPLLLLMSHFDKPVIKIIIITTKGPPTETDQESKYCGN